ncbi:MAG: hypothetical protein ACREP0_01640 [Rhodanobacteraceae bacterium]
MWRVGACYAVLLGLALGYGLPAHATRFDFAAGRSVPGPAAGDADAATVAFLTAAGLPGAAAQVRLQLVGTLGWIGSHDVDRGGLDRPAFVAGGGARYRFFRRLFVSEQIIATSVRTSALSSRFEFMTTLGVHVGRFLLMGRHISNAHLIGGGPNHGETMLLVGVEF